MTANTFMSVDEVANELGISKSYAYKIVQRLNDELKVKGFITISGRVAAIFVFIRYCFDISFCEPESKLHHQSN